MSSTTAGSGLRCQHRRGPQVESTCCSSTTAPWVWACRSGSSGLEVGETDLLGIHAMKMRPHYQPPYEEALPWRTTP